METMKVKWASTAAATAMNPIPRATRHTGACCGLSSRSMPRFAVEIGAGLAAGSASLQADALDVLGDAANDAISRLVGLAPPNSCCLRR
jgi:class 3 adenylate cyclase